MGTVDFIPRFGTGCALSSGITFENYGTMKNVPSEWEMEVI
jgi:hypothetical protein